MLTQVIRLKRWKVEVSYLRETDPTSYIVIAADEMDARIIAFCLDDGFPLGTTEMDKGDIRVIKMHTKVLKVSNA
jgi:hypothetical protein